MARLTGVWCHHVQLRKNRMWYILGEHNTATPLHSSLNVATQELHDTVYSNYSSGPIHWELGTLSLLSQGHKAGLALRDVPSSEMPWGEGISRAKKSPEVTTHPFWRLQQLEQPLSLQPSAAWFLDFEMPFSRFLHLPVTEQSSSCGWCVTRDYHFPSCCLSDLGMDKTSLLDPPQKFTLPK